MTTKQTIIVIGVVILVVLVVLLSAAEDKLQELEKYSSLEIGLGLLFILSPLWFPLAWALAWMPKRR